MVAWVRKKLETSKPKAPWEETEEDYGERLKNIFRDINANCDIPGLCAEFPGRVQRVVDGEGKPPSIFDAKGKTNHALSSSIAAKVSTAHDGARSLLSFRRHCASIA